MPHVNPDLLALLALGEDVGSPEERAHLARCGDCHARIAELAEAAAIGRSTLAGERLATPPARVWEGIATELGLDVPAPAVRRRRRGRRLGVVLAAVVVVLAGAGASILLVQHAEQPRIVARADLVHLPGWTGASGQAEIEQYGDGRRVAVVSTNVAPSRSRGHEVWLMDAATGARVGLGFLRQESGVFVLPAGANLKVYSYIDVSSEPHDGNPAPSGDSIVRGALEP